MNAREFVGCWRREKDRLLDDFTDPLGELLVSKKIAALNLSPGQQAAIKEIIDDILTDTFYTLLLGLGGEANIGGIQETYVIHDEQGNVISSCGEIEAEAWEQFHGSKE
jgi:hypothetical protein